LLQVALGDKTDIELVVPLPPRPKRKHEQWSKWTSEGFLHGRGEPPVSEYAFRSRVQSARQAEKERDQAKAGFLEEREQAAAALSPDAPLTDWTPFFEDGDSGLPYYSEVGRAVGVINARAPELEAPLRSPDRRLVRQAVYGAAELREIPAILIQPLADAGRLTLTLIEEATNAALPDDPDLIAEAKAYAFFFRWGLAMKRAGSAAAEQHRVVLAEIESEASQVKAGDIEAISRYAREDLRNLGAMPQD